MKSTILITFVLTTIVVQAQTPLKVHPTEKAIIKQNHFECYSFQVENKCHVVVNRAQPNSTIDFYSNYNGGKLLSRKKSDEAGSLKTSFSAEDTPSFVLNREQQNFVQFFDKHDFVLKNIKLEWEGTNLLLTFNAADNDQKDITYRLIATKKGVKNVIEQFESSADLEYMAASFQHQAKTTYSLSIYSGSEERYSIPLKLAEDKNAYLIYPTVTTSIINIDLLSDFSSARYTILNSQGKLVEKGELFSAFNKLNIQPFSKGSYFIRLTIDGETSNGEKIIKK
ncbi:MAG: T9SS type A sorting domain-containing protein [Rhodobacteraceae bacterium]|nr:T9SS type A sorting domain-containing protein [Paracoccaceae bacterium]